MKYLGISGQPLTGNKGIPMRSRLEVTFFFSQISAANYQLGFHMEICHEAWGNRLILGIYHPSSNMTLKIPQNGLLGGFSPPLLKKNSQLGLLFPIDGMIIPKYDGK